MILVVVVLPLVPLTSTTPSGNLASNRPRKWGDSFSTTSPGKAEPWPLPRCRDKKTKHLPIRLTNHIISNSPHSITLSP